MDSIAIGLYDILSCIVCFVVGIYLWVNKKSDVSQMLLSAMLVTYACELLSIGLLKIGYVPFESRHILYPIHFTVAHMVILFLYFKTLLDPNQAKKYYWLIGLGVIDWLIFITLDIFHDHFSAELISAIIPKYSFAIFILFFFLSVYMLFKIIGIPPGSHIRRSNLLQYQTTVLSYLSVYYIVYTSIVIISQGGSGIQYTLFSVMNGTFAIALAILFLYGYLKYRNEYQIEKEGRINETSTHPDKLVSNSTLVNSDSNTNTQISKSKKDFTRINNKIIEDQLFLDKDLSLAKLSQSLKMNGRRISESILNETSMNLKSYINTMRVEHSILLLKDHNREQLTIKSIAEASGFKSTSAFYASFKEKTGVTPIEIKDNYKNSQPNE